MSKEAHQSLALDFALRTSFGWRAQSEGCPPVGGLPPYSRGRIEAAGLQGQFLLTRRWRRSFFQLGWRREGCGSGD